MNAGMIAEMLKLPPEKAKALSKAWDFASAAAAGVNSREDAMRVLAEKNIGDEVLDKAVGYLNNPLASVAAQMTGINLAQLRQDLNSLRGAAGGSQSVDFSGASNNMDTQMEALRKGLQQLR